MRFLFIICLIGCYNLSSSGNCQATWMAYEFAGAPSHSLSAPFGISVPVNQPISGRFIYDTLSLPESVPGCLNCAQYRQSFTGGLQAKFGLLDIVADEYLIQVSNNYPQPGGGVVDIVSIRWASNATPTLSPIRVNGISQTTGLLSINLIGSSTLFSNTALPVQLNLASFASTTSYLADTPTGFIDVLFALNSLTSFELDLDLPAYPEPSSSLLWIFMLISSRHLLSMRPRREAR